MVKLFKELPADAQCAVATCLVRSPAGTGCGVLVFIEQLGVCLLTSQHLLRSVEDCRKCKIHLSVTPRNSNPHTDGRKEPGRASTRSPSTSINRGPRLELYPQKTFISSPKPPPGSPADQEHLDYTLVPCEQPAGVALLPLTLPARVAAASTSTPCSKAADLLHHRVILPRHHLADKPPEPASHAAPSPSSWSSTRATAAQAPQPSSTVPARAPSPDPHGFLASTAAPTSLDTPEPKSLQSRADYTSRNSHLAMTTTQGSGEQRRSRKMAGDGMFVGAGPMRRCVEEWGVGEGVEASQPSPTDASSGAYRVEYAISEGTVTRVRDVICNYTAVTNDGASGCPVMAASRAAEEPAGPTGGAVHCLQIIAIHRAGASGHSGEGVLISAILFDILRTIQRRSAARLALQGSTLARLQGSTSAGLNNPTPSELQGTDSPGPHVSIAYGLGGDMGAAGARKGLHAIMKRHPGERRSVRMMPHAVSRTKIKEDGSTLPA